MITMKSNIRNKRVKKNLRVRFLLDPSTDRSIHVGYDKGGYDNKRRAVNTSVYTHAPAAYSTTRSRCYICDSYRRGTSSAGSLSSSSQSHKRSAGSSIGGSLGNHSNHNSFYSHINNSAGSLNRIPPYYDYYTGIVSSLTPQMHVYYC
ncbi:hypothetical protein E3P92_02769 [Wallemia ichthyophaga]|uniref:Uncharacterized protein n=2 Tax=Wallemia ichthyophaga TaxID=245174 RepID=A0A4T0JC56_WALIC|nr:hypothetical protein E3P91_02722 [Wallemia ichthyophaga]TIA80826.1 hypothetical protein E3P98_02438 [Wallemia ichthyophaga]TIA89709.1 hypothetical protein E3P97_02894 [Wallemia ichthyophaga]TIA98352.1 hypothetical protein E3P95_02473 [Wallemia ichthyophaga]TIA99502.1 hypothetical protein E3P94_02545 [Wallemia ichthyophaga]